MRYSNFNFISLTIYVQSSDQSDVFFEFILQVQEYKDSLKTKVISLE